jgi:hypothetical protein
MKFVYNWHFLFVFIADWKVDTETKTNNVTTARAVHVFVGKCFLVESDCCVCCSSWTLASGAVTALSLVRFFSGAMHLLKWCSRSTEGLAVEIFTWT